MEEKIEQYCLLAKGARGRALADLIQKATGEPSLFAFGEILDVDSVKELQNSEFKSSYQLLKLFAYGTWKDYTGRQEAYPSLDEKQKLKLRQLTIVSIAEQMKVIPYSHLMEELDISNVRELEDLLITDCFYGQLMKGKLDQNQRYLHVHDVVSRDVAAEDVDNIINALGDWLQTSERILQDLEDKVTHAAQTSAEAQAQKEAFEAKIEEDKTLYKGGPSASQESMSLEEGGTSMLDYMEQDRGINRPKRRR